MKSHLVLFGIFFGLCSAVMHARILTVKNNFRNLSAVIELNGQKIGEVKGNATVHKNVPDEQFQLKFSLAPNDTVITIAKGTEQVCVELWYQDVLKAREIRCEK